MVGGRRARRVGVSRRTRAMSAMVFVRLADAGDAPALAALRWEFRAGRDRPVEAEQAFVDRCLAWMARELAGPVWRAWVAIDDGRIVGQVWMQQFQKLPNPVGERERHAYL